jgi:predicted glycosyltransferase
MRLMVYSHDTFGLGNISRMLAICNYLLKAIPKLSILVVSGSPMLHSFRLPQGLDYVKLPCLNRGESGKLSAKYLNTETDETVKLRSEIILATAINFKPDMFLVDKKPDGIAGELKATIKYLQCVLPETKLILLLRDILDSPEVTIPEWKNNGYHESIYFYYNQILVVGMPEIFDLTKEYQFPAHTAKKVRFCGYICKEPGLKTGSILRQELQIKSDEQLVLVTPGGGQDGDYLIENYFASLEHLPESHKLKSVIMCGPEMKASQKQAFYETAQKYPQVQISEFTDDLMSYMEAADIVVSMGGYNTVTEILSLGKKSIIVPRVKPAKEQLIRAERLDELGLVKMIHPDCLTPQGLMETILEQLRDSTSHLPGVSRLDLDGLPQTTSYIYNLLHGIESDEFAYSYSKSLDFYLPTAV